MQASENKHGGERHGPALYNQLVEKFLDVLEWSPAKKAILILSFVAPFQAGWVVIGEIALNNETSPINWAAWRTYHLIWLATQLLTILFAWWLVKINFQKIWPINITTTIFCWFVIGQMYAFGTMNSMHVAYLVGVPAVLLVVFGMRSTLICLTASFLLITVLMILESLSLIPFAPAIIDRSVDSLSHPGYLIALVTFYLLVVGQVLLLTQFTISAREHSEQKLAHANEVIKRYIPKKVANRIYSGDQSIIEPPARRRISILFADIEGFTIITDILEPEVTTQLLNEYMSAMADIVESHDGTLNEFMGDGLIAIFGAPDELPDQEHAVLAVRTAQSIQKKLVELNHSWRDLGLSTGLNVRIGINTGMSNVGSFGSEGRMTYTAIGRNVNIAARIQSHCEPGGILLSDTSWHLVKDQIDCEPKGEVECKGVHFPVKVYMPKGVE